MMTTSDKTAQYVMPTYGRIDMVPVRGQGSWLWDDQGRKYLDFCTGIAVCCLGHCHPKVVGALQKQAETLMHCSNLFQVQPQADLAEIIVEKCVQSPGKIFFANSGAEANDGLIKSARRFGHRKPTAEGTPRTHIITFQQSFHGRTFGGMAATGQEKIKGEFYPMLEGFSYATLNDLESVKAVLTPETVAIMLEPVQGEGGVYPVTPEFLREIEKLCREHDMLLLLDEVQVGFGRCGNLMGWKAIAPEVQPDGISWAKGLGGGVSIGAFYLSDRAIDESGAALSSIMSPGSHGSTYGGNPLSAATSLAVVTELVEGNWSNHAQKMGEMIKREISSWNLPTVELVRGYGLLLGVILNESQWNIPEGMMPSVYVVGLLREEGLLTVPAGPQAVRLLPPLNVSEEEINQALEILKRVLTPV